MVKPNLNRLIYIGFSDGFVIRDKEGNIFLRTIRNTTIEHAQSSLQGFTYSKIISNAYIGERAQRVVNKFIRDVNNLDLDTVIRIKK